MYSKPRGGIRHIFGWVTESQSVFSLRIYIKFVSNVTSLLKQLRF